MNVAQPDTNWIEIFDFDNNSLKTPTKEIWINKERDIDYGLTLTKARDILTANLELYEVETTITNKKIADHIADLEFITVQLTLNNNTLQFRKRKVENVHVTDFDEMHNITFLVSDITFLNHGP